MIAEQLKGRSSSLVQKNIHNYEKGIEGQRFKGKGLGAWITGNITNEMVQNYLEHHRKPNNHKSNNFMLE